MKMSIGDQTVDIIDPEITQVQVSRDGRTLWVNVDGVCRLRVSASKVMVIDVQSECVVTAKDGQFSFARTLQ